MMPELFGDQLPGCGRLQGRHIQCRLDTGVLELVEVDAAAGSSLWKLADVKRNRPGTWPIAFHDPMIFSHPVCWTASLVHPQDQLSQMSDRGTRNIASQPKKRPMLHWAGQGRIDNLDLHGVLLMPFSLLAIASRGGYQMTIRHLSRRAHCMSNGMHSPVIF